MELKNQSILLIGRATQHAGTENVMLQICEIFKPLVKNIVVCCAEGFKKEELERLGVRYYSIPDIQKKDLKTILTISNTLKKIVKKEKITVIHTHHRMAALYVTLFRLYKKRYFINTSHNTFEDKIILTRFAYKHAKLIACGEMVKKNLTEVYQLKDISVVHNAVKPFTETIKEDKLIQDLHALNRYVVGNVGRFSEQKGMVYYIQAIPDVIKKHPEARFLLIGSGEDERRLRKMVAELNISEYIYFTGFRNDIQNVMAQLDLIVLSSLWEGLPLTPIEAFSVNKTIVATAVDGTVEIVENGKSGFLITPKNTKQISDKIIWFIEHPEEQREMELAAKERFISEFSFENLSNGYIKCYKRLRKKEN